MMLHQFMSGLLGGRYTDDNPPLMYLISEAFAGIEAALSTTEWSMPFDAAYAAGTNKTDDGVFQLFIDTSDMVAGDELRVRIYEKVQSSGTQRMIYQSSIFGVQSPPSWVGPSLMLMHGWDMTITALVGTISVEWSIRKAA